MTQFDSARSTCKDVNGQRTVTIRGDVDTRLANTSGIISELERRFLADYSAKHPNVHISIEGETKESATTQASMVWASLIGIVGMVVLLSFQFRSYVESLTVMAAAPFALIGVVWGHMLLGIDISMPSLLGLASLAGVVVND